MSSQVNNQRSVGKGSASPIVSSFFRIGNPYAKYHRCNDGATPNPSARRRRQQQQLERNYRPPSSCLVFGSAFSPAGGGLNGKRYLVGCSSYGSICVWDTCSNESAYCHSREEEGGTGKRAGCHASSSLEPILRIGVPPADISNGTTVGTGGKQTLYDLQFIKRVDGNHFLVASGDAGVLVYRWSDFQLAIEFALERTDVEETLAAESWKQDGRGVPKKRRGVYSCDSRNPSRTCVSPIIHPVARFFPHPSPGQLFGDVVEINSTSYNTHDNVLYGAAGDAFGCYRWDLATEKLMGTFGGTTLGCRRDVGGTGSGHTDYLHSVKTIPKDAAGGFGCNDVLTGGEDGKMGFWSGKEGKLIEMFDLKVVLDKCKDFVQADGSGTTNRPWTSWGNAAKLSVAAMDMNSNWLAVGGGVEYGRGAGRGTNNGGGFMTLWHLPTRSFTSGYVTRESVNTVAYHPEMDRIVSGGNEGRISFWSSTAFNRREGRAWITSPASYTISVNPDSGVMAVGGSGDILDCFTDHVKTSQVMLNT